jgi:hypothetical protein
VVVVLPGDGELEFEKAGEHAALATRGVQMQEVGQTIASIGTQVRSVLGLSGSRWSSVQ